ncbi:MAG: DUF523 domain-containing protein [Victivallales bacterium]|jgi:uncharacterized protein YbbK (DUF523 family)|nr:DUF523 domain-containing protein [Victivallales bacterium]
MKASCKKWLEGIFKNWLELQNWQMRNLKVRFCEMCFFTKFPVLRGSQKPKVGISACLLGCPVRYDGQNKLDLLFAGELSKQIDWVPICPETAFGLPTPRESIQLEGDPENPSLRKVNSRDDLSNTYRDFCRCKVAKLPPLAGFVFKAKSPSCGMRVSVHNQETITGYAPGFFASAWLQSHPDLPSAEAEELHDPAKLQEFLDKVSLSGSF